MKFYTTILTACLFAAAPLCAQSQAPEDMSNEQLQAKADESIQAQDLAAARPYLNEILLRVEGDEAREPAEFFIALSYLNEYSQGNEDRALLEKTVTLFREYLEKYPDAPRSLLARYNLANALLGLERYEEALPLFTEVYTDDRYSETGQDALAKINFLYIQLGRLEDGLPWFEESLQNAQSQNEVAEAATKIVRTFLENGETDKVRRYLKYLAIEAPAVYEPKFNALLVSTGDKLFDESEYGLASLFYALAKTPDEIIDFLEKRIAQLERQVEVARGSRDGNHRFLRLQTELQTAKAHLDAARATKDYEAELRWREARILLTTGRAWEAYWAFKNLAEDFPEHPSFENIQYLQFSQAAKVGYDEVVADLGRNYLDNPNNRKFRGQVALDLSEYYLSNQQYDKLFILVREFIETNGGAVPAEVLLNQNGRARLITGEFSQLIPDFREHLELLEGTRVEPVVRYWLGFGHLLNGRNERALEELNAFLENGKGFSLYSDGIYRKGMALIGLNRFEEAEKELTRFVEEYPDAPARGEAELFLGDIAIGNGNYEKAIRHYETVENHTDRPAFIWKSYESKANLLYDLDRKDEALNILETYRDTYPSDPPADDSMATKAEILGLMDRTGDRLRTLLKGVRVYGSDPTRESVDAMLFDFAREMVEIREGIEASIDLIEEVQAGEIDLAKLVGDRTFQYNFFTERDSVDEGLKRKFIYDDTFRTEVLEDPSLLQQELADYRALLAELPGGSAADVLKQLHAEAVSEADRTLALRIEMVYESVFGENPFGDDYSVEDFRLSSPRTTVWLVDKVYLGFETERDVVLREVVRRNPESPAAREALLKLVESAMADGNYENALAYLETAVQRFRTSTADADLLIRKGDILREMRRYEDAIQTYARVTERKEWRGAAHAEALYKTGLAYRSLDENLKAHGFFERVLIGYQAFREWAALAYHQDILLLLEIGQSADALQTYDEFQRLQGFENTEGYRMIQELNISENS